MSKKTVCSMSDTPPFDFTTFLRDLTTKSGVYRMLDSTGEVIYVGKARNLKKRVASYFTRADRSPKTRVMVRQIRNIEITVTHTEKEALILENNQIKRLKPRYNIWFKDDKSYPYIYLSDTHDFPALHYHRGSRKKKGRYFGPYPSAAAVRDTLGLIKKLFLTRQCKDGFFANRTRPCLEYQIKRCSAPCTGLISQKEYRKDIERTVMFLEGKNEQVMESLIIPMQRATDALEYERAARYRDQIVNLRRLNENQYITSEKGDIDIVACCYREGVACVLVVFIRNGLNQGSQANFPVIHYADDAEFEPSIMEAFLAQHYLKSFTSIPDEILLSHEPANRALLEEVISAHAERRVKLKYRLRGDRAKRMKMALENTELALQQRIAECSSRQQRTEQLRQFLALDMPIRRMECFDISHMGGEAAVASCVVFNAEGPLKSDYRRFSIEGITPGDDYAAMEQAILRRYTRVKKEAGQLPDVIFIDGGQGQIGVVRKVLDELQIDGPILIGIAKGASRKPGMETLIMECDDWRRRLPPHSEVLHLIQRIRDEAHRFAVGGHRLRRRRARRQSPLETIDGVGNKRRRSLLRHFGGLKGIVSAGVDDLAKVDGINKNLAQKIYDTFHEEQ